MYLLPNEKPEGSSLKILSGKKRLSLLRVNISDHCPLFWGGTSKPPRREEGTGAAGNGFGSRLCLPLLEPCVTSSWLLGLSVPRCPPM